MGWHDNREHAPGILTGILAKDVTALSGTSAEGLAVMFEAAVAILTGVAAGFYFDWKLATVALLLTPFNFAGAVISARQ